MQQNRRHWLKSRIDAQNEIGQLFYAGIVGTGVQDPLVNGEMLPVVAREAFRPGDFVHDVGFIFGLANLM
ncbi:hypothetical protein [Mesorhizobium sp. M7A.F.Ca.ET.027.03.2.1]|uniref:hypothetical protein n=1 Tax=Mesorhizobium sp. M7A.F.Ca.ET.027.03.2.1 TaxID=2496656 RepID=UPI001FE105A1|nr:hypothetical protein [Mesorhizobium sp. M7A.F.Ca.ET.027.03.2.1]